VVDQTSRFVFFISFALAASYWGLNPASLPTQTVSEKILGQIQDHQGAAIPKAEVSALNLETGAVRKTTTEDNGEYRITSVPAGSYEVTAPIAGFKTDMRKGIIL